MHGGDSGGNGTRHQLCPIRMGTDSDSSQAGSDEDTNSVWGGCVDCWGAGEVGGGSAAERWRERDGAGRKTGEKGEGVSPVKTKGEERRECLLGGNKRTVRKANNGLGGRHRHRNVFINT